MRSNSPTRFVLVLSTALLLAVGAARAQVLPPNPHGPKNGIPRLKVEEHLTVRKDSLAKLAESVPATTSSGRGAGGGW